MLLRQGVFLLSTLCLNDRLFVEHRVEVEHQYINVVSSVTRLYKQFAGLGVITEAEGNMLLSPKFKMLILYKWLPSKGLGHNI